MELHLTKNDYKYYGDLYMFDEKYHQVLPPPLYNYRKQYWKKLKDPKNSDETIMYVLHSLKFVKHQQGGCTIKCNKIISAVGQIFVL